MSDHRRWMSNVDGSKLLSELTIPGSHDSATSTLLAWARTQKLKIPVQLELGCRFLDLRCNVNKNNRLQLRHGNTKVPNLLLEDVLRFCAAFLRRNPDECIIASIKKEGNPAPRKKNFHTVLKEYLKDPEFAPLWWISPRIPTLGEVRGKVVYVARGTQYLGGLKFRLDDDTSGRVEIKGDDVLIYEDHYTANVTEKKRFIAKNIKAAQESKIPQELYLTFTSKTNPRPAAYRLNRWLRKTIVNDGRRMGIVAMDFFDEEMVDYLLADAALGARPSV